MKPGNRLVIEMVPIHIKLITLEDERKMNQCFLNFAKVRKHFLMALCQIGLMSPNIEIKQP